MTFFYVVLAKFGLQYLNLAYILQIPLIQPQGQNDSDR